MNLPRQNNPEQLEFKKSVVKENPNGSIKLKVESIKHPKLSVTVTV